MNWGEFLNEYYKGMSVHEDQHQGHPSRKTEHYHHEKGGVEANHWHSKRVVHAETQVELTQLKNSSGVEKRRKWKETGQKADYRALIHDLIENYLPNSVIDESFALSIIEQESKYNSDAVSHTWVRGLCQITWQTLKHITATNRDLVRDNPKNRELFISDEVTSRGGKIDYWRALAPKNQIKLMLSYLSQIEKQFNFIRNPDFKKDVIIASYNLWPWRVWSLLRNHNIDTTSELKSAILATRGISRSKKHETINYIAQINRNMGKYA